MAKSLLIVESPTKAKTLQKYLGKEYDVRSTKGHVRDLPKNELGVDVTKDFHAKYVTIVGKAKVISELKKAAAGVPDIYLGPDPDREGEAIAWHIAESLGEENHRFHRVLLMELTQKGIKEALAKPVSLDRARFESQQARRILDRLVGYQLSPLLWQKVKAGLSAGRVQSVALRIMVDREKLILAFIPEEYWTMTACLAGQEPPKWADEEKNFADLHERIAKTITHLQTFKPAQFDGAETRAIELKFPNGTFNFVGTDYFLKFVVPNFYFHYSAAYAILRHNGVPIGKTDFLGGR